MFSLGCGIWREFRLFSFLNIIRASLVLGTPTIFDELEHVESVSVTSREVREKIAIHAPSPV